VYMPPDDTTTTPVFATEWGRGGIYGAGSKRQ
jgi:hypothetical protein